MYLSAFIILPLLFFFYLMQISEKGLSAGRAIKYAGKKMKTLSSIMVLRLRRWSSKSGWSSWAFLVRPVMSKHRLCWLLGNEKSRFCLKYESFWGNGTCSEGKNQELGLNLKLNSWLCCRLTSSFALQNLCVLLKVKVDGHLCQNLALRFGIHWNRKLQYFVNVRDKKWKHSVICSNKPTKCCLGKKQLFGEEDLEELEFILGSGILREELVVMLTARIKKNLLAP